MIARTVNNYVPKDVLLCQQFKRYIVKDKDVTNKELMNIDVLNI